MGAAVQRLCATDQRINSPLRYGYAEVAAGEREGPL
jgi:hypothetical protein